MIDLKLLRQSPKKVIKSTKDRGYNINITKLVKLDKEFLSLKQNVEKLRHQRNEITKNMGLCGIYHTSFFVFFIWQLCF